MKSFSSEYIPDPIERGEDAVEDWYFKNVENGVAKCTCGNTFIFEDGETLSADPYAIPVCSECFSKCCDSKINSEESGV